MAGTDLFRRDRHAAELAEHVARDVDTFPPLTPEQCRRIVALLRAGPEDTTGPGVHREAEPSARTVPAGSISRAETTTLRVATRGIRSRIRRGDPLTVAERVALEELILEAASIVDAANRSAVSRDR